MPSFSISNGKSGAKNEEKISCAICAIEIVSTSALLNVLFKIIPI
jgi:hypothetical protein